MPSKRPAPPAAEPPDEDGENDSPPPRSKDRSAPRPPSTNGGSAPRGGWGGSQEVMDSTSSWAQGFRPEERSQIIAFAEEGPYVGYRRHWVDRQTKDGKQTRSYVCLQSVGKDCPLCEVGVRPQAVSAFNVFVLDPNGDVSLKSWDVGARLFQVLKSYANDPKIGPLTKGFFLVSKTGQKASTQYNVSPIKRTALTEDYDTPIPDEDRLKQFHLYDPEILQIPLPKELREIADEMTDDYE